MLTGELLKITDTEPPLEALIHVLEGVEEGGTVRVLTNKATVFNNPDVKNAFREAKRIRRAASIKAVTGLIVVTDTDGHNGLLDLHQEEVDGVPVVDQMHHFEVLGFYDEYFAVENPNRPLLYWGPAQDLSLVTHSFDRWAEMLRVRTNPEVGLLPLRMSEANFKTLIDRVAYLDVHLTPRLLLSLPETKGLFLNQ